MPAISAKSGTPSPTQIMLHRKQEGESRCLLPKPAAFEGSSGAAGSAAVEAIAGIAVIVLTMLGLAHVVPVFLVAIAAIIAGVALVAQGATIAAEYARLVTVQSDVFVPLGNSSAWSLALLAGAAGIVLGILALLNVAPVELVAIAVIAFGGGLIISGGPTARSAMPC